MLCCSASCRWGCFPSKRLPTIFEWEKAARNGLTATAISDLPLYLLLVVCLLVCAIDGKVSAKEKKWIKQLIR